ncbi:MAG: hypothetical protein O6951_04090 [Actinobacteria bacterium]|nr:hypothetical protein [Actinomycetota bacterium]
MRRATPRAAAIFALLIGGLVLLTVPVLAQDEEPSPAPISEDAPVQISEEMEPAVPITIPDESETQLDWTYRFMIPIGLVLAVVVIAVTSVQYFTSVVRKRYRIVEE